MYRKRLRFSLLSSYVVLFSLMLVTSLARAQATNASLNGTYTFELGSPNQYFVQSNMFNQQVGFCNGSQIPFGYSCFMNFGQAVIAGTFIADGAGNITTGSTYTFTADPNQYQCASKNSPAPVCPYKAPWGVAWNSTTAYVVGDVVDYQESNGKVLTFQAVKKNTNVAPVSGTASVCTTSTAKNPPSCYWDQLLASATGNGSGAGTLTGTYSVQSNGSGVITVTPSGNPTVGFAIIVRGTSSLGQEVPMIAMPQLGNEFRGGGSAVRIK